MMIPPEERRARQLRSVLLDRAMRKALDAMAESNFDEAERQVRIFAALSVLGLGEYVQSWSEGICF